MRALGFDFICCLRTRHRRRPHRRDASFTASVLPHLESGYVSVPSPSCRDAGATVVQEALTRRPRRTPGKLVGE